MNKFLILARNEARDIDRRFKHVSIITNKRGHILSIGANRRKTHPLNVRLGYRDVQIHSELDAYSKLSYTDKQKQLYLYNYRFNSNLVIGMAKPCVYCMPWCINIFERIYYTDENGELCMVNG